MTNLTEKWKKLYVTRGNLEKIIAEIIRFCPLMDKFNTMDQKKVDLLKVVLKLINWDELQFEVVDNQEAKGDCFLYWYFEQGEKIPRLKMLESEDLENIIMDENNQPIAYIYKEEVVTEFLQRATATVMTTSRTVKWVFERGKVTILDPIMQDGKYTYDIEGKIIYNKTENPNRIKYKDLFQIIHIPSFKKQSAKFSDICAEEYVDDCLVLDSIHSDWRSINHNAGFPKIFAIDIGEITGGSKNSPAGVILCKSDANNGTNQGKLEQIQITNSLDSIEKEETKVEENLYRKANLIRPQLEMKLGSSDSSRVIAQLLLPLQLKLEKYLTQIAEKMEVYFTVCLMEEGLWKKKDKPVTFLLPTPIIKQSIFDELLVKAQEIAIKDKSRAQMDREQGLNKEESDQKQEEIAQEIRTVTEQTKPIQDKQVKNIVGNASNLDNNFKK